MAKEPNSWENFKWEKSKVEEFHQRNNHWIACVKVEILAYWTGKKYETHEFVDFSDYNELTIENLHEACKKKTTVPQWVL